MQSLQAKKQQAANLIASLPYTNAKLAETQINQLLHQINTLNSSVELYFFDNGAQARLLKLEGTIPILYQNNQYNIPVAFRLPYGFPVHPPLCFVTPVMGMSIKPKHLHVDVQGKIYHPYITNWDKSQSTIVELIVLLCSVFGQDPPVFSNVNAQQQAMRQQSNYNWNNVNANNNNNNNNNNNYFAYGQGLQQVQQQQQQQQIQQQPQQQQQQQQQQVLNNNASNEAKIDETLQKVKKIVKEELDAIHQSENNELNQIASKQKELDANGQILNDINNKLNEEYELLFSRKQQLTQQISALQQWLELNENTDSISIDKVVVASDTWSQQCMEAVADDVCLNDLILELDKCLENETINLEQYLKQMGKIARDQFMKRALSTAVYHQQNSNVQKTEPQLAQLQMNRPFRYGGKA